MRVLVQHILQGVLFRTAKNFDQSLVVNKCDEDLKESEICSTSILLPVTNSTNLIWVIWQDWAQEEAELQLGLARYVILRARRNTHARPMHACSLLIYLMFSD